MTESLGNSELLEARQGRQPQGGGGQLGNESHREGSVKGAEGRFRWPQGPRPRCPEKMHVCLKVSAACQSDGQEAWKLVPEGSRGRQGKGDLASAHPSPPSTPQAHQRGSKPQGHIARSLSYALRTLLRKVPRACRGCFWVWGTLSRVCRNPKHHLTPRSSKDWVTQLTNNPDVARRACSPASGEEGLKHLPQPSGGTALPTPGSWTCSLQNREMGSVEAAHSWLIVSAALGVNSSVLRF